MPKLTKYISRILNFYGKGKHKYIYKDTKKVKWTGLKKYPLLEAAQKVKLRGSRAEKALIKKVTQTQFGPGRVPRGTARLRAQRKQRDFNIKKFGFSKVK